MLTVALPDAYVEHGNVSLLREALGIDSDSIIRAMRAHYPELKSRTGGDEEEQ